MLKNNISTIALIFGFAVIIKKITMLENKIKVIEKSNKIEIKETTQIEADKSCDKIIHEIKYHYEEDIPLEKMTETKEPKENEQEQEIKEEETLEEDIPLEKMTETKEPKENEQEQEIKEEETLEEEIKEEDSHYEHVLKDIVTITTTKQPQVRHSFWNIFM